MIAEAEIYREGRQAGSSGRSCGAFLSTKSKGRLGGWEFKQDFYVTVFESEFLLLGNPPFSVLALKAFN